ncbi:Detected protein of confused Function [Hibiscus syriacus]|uniref:Detected protein of confused Function n=1 Tax=Hibiscus syriacus TaxID=106335 RepID=A0A6A3CXS5_HIBSY|nr:Detected protein of confused Function [Hibiscus syriacus]
MNFGGHLMELKAELNGFLLESKKKDMEYSHVGEKWVKDEEPKQIDEKLQNEDDIKCIYDDDDDDDVIMDLDTNEKLSTHKRKRDSMWGMLNWVTEIAKDPCDSGIGLLAERSRWKSYGSQNLWKQILLFREAAFLRNYDFPSSDQSDSQKNHRVHPCDDLTKLGYNLRERLSSTKQLHLGKMASKRLDRSPSSSTGNHSGLCSSVLSTYCDSATLGLLFNYNVNIHVPIGPLFQVEVPEWTGGASKSNPKWLGTRVWPSEKKKNKFMIERDRIGKGRQDSCGCQIRDSIQCVRFHVAEKRLKVKLELGFAFYRWKFDKMGEEVAFSWKEEQEKMFSCIAKSNPLSLWDEICKHFHNKSREELVCYYFNVFLLQHKAYHSRVTPRNNNDDDDYDEEIGAEAEVVGEGIGHKPTMSYTSILSSPKKEKKSRYSPQFNMEPFDNIKSLDALESVFGSCFSVSYFE